MRTPKCRTARTNMRTADIGYSLDRARSESVLRHGVLYDPACGVIFSPAAVLFNRSAREEIVAELGAYCGAPDRYEAVNLGTHEATVPDPLVAARANIEQ